MVPVDKIKLYDKEIVVRKYGCIRNQNIKPNPYLIPRVNLFIQTTNNCNSNCEFCIYHNCKKPEFNTNKLSEIIKYLSEQSQLRNLDVGKINFTGGEPLLDIDLFDKIIYSCSNNLNLVEKPVITLNTNGTNITKILDYEDLLDSVGLSKHHYDYSKNCEIFKTKNIPYNFILKDFQQKLKNKSLIQLRCNLIKGYIDSEEEIIKYMNHSLTIGIHDCGFVTLAPNNDYCKSHQVNFPGIIKSIESNEKIVEVNQWRRIDDITKDEYCLCKNYVYMNHYGEFCKFYSRLFCHNENSDGILVYDGQNLRHGFSGKIIY